MAADNVKQTLFVCPRCQIRFLSDPSNRDFVHECNSGNPVLDQEDILLIGRWEDYTGSDTPPLGQVLNRSRLNKLAGTRGAIEGEWLHNYTVRGNNADTTRQRQHLQYNDLR